MASIMEYCEKLSTSQLKAVLREELEGRGNLPVEIILQICQVLAKRDAGLPSYRDSVLQMCKNYLD